MIPGPRIASHLMAAIGLGVLALTGQINGLLLGFGALCLVVSLMMDRLNLPLGLSTGATNLLIVTVLAFAVVDYLWLSTTLLHVGSHILVLLMLTRLRHRDSREYLQLAVIVFLQVLASAGLTSRGEFAAGFLAYLVVMVWVLLQYHFMDEAERAGQRTPAEGFSGVSGWASMAAGVTLLVTTVLFVFIPRAGFGILAAAPQADVRLVGFSPRVEFGTLGPLKRDPTVVMRVSGADVAPGLDPLYLRGAVFDAYDGRAWRSSSQARRLLNIDGDGRFVLAPVPPDSTNYTIRLEPIDSPVLFAPLRTAAIEGPFAMVSVDEQGAFGVPHTARTGVTYDLWQSPPGRPAASGADAAETNQVARNLVAPESPSIARLARDAAQEADTPLARARAVERFLKSRYTYTLDVPDEGERPIEEFLFHRRSGFCEHFASAMVLMLRTLGIPARLVNGFLVTEWNEYGRYYIVRQGDAHAWVEAFLPELGWTRFDPTPSAPVNDRPWTGVVQHYLDHLRLEWDRHVVEYGLGDQDAAIDRLQTAWAETRDALASRASDAAARWRALSAMRPPGWVFAGLAMGGLAFALWLAARAWLRRARTDLSPRSTSVDFYERLLAALAARGLTRAASTTPRELAARAAHGPWAREVSLLTDVYYGVRYGRRRLSAADHRAVNSALAAIEANPPPKP